MKSRPKPTGCRIYVGLAVCDGQGVSIPNGAILFDEHRRVLDVGPQKQVESKAPSHVERIELSRAILLPGLVNAHAHLDLTAIGPIPYGGDFIAWIGQVIARRPQDDQAIEASTCQGIEKSLAAGVLRMGDICGSPKAFQTLQQSSMLGVGFLEFLGPDGPPDDWPPPAIQPWIENPFDSTLHVGLQPHAPYSTDETWYAWALEKHHKTQIPLCTHLAETQEELEYVAQATGPFQKLLERLGQWDRRKSQSFGRHQHPLTWLLDQSPKSPWLLAHVNYATDEQLALAATSNISVAYCPRASDYFGHRSHPYPQMMDLGINVCLGTDSILCHGDLSILEEMRYLHQRDSIDGNTLLQMATTSGMRALGLNPTDATFESGAAPGLIGVTYDGPLGPHPIDDLLDGSAPFEIQVLEPAL